MRKENEVKYEGMDVRDTAELEEEAERNWPRESGNSMMLKRVRGGAWAGAQPHSAHLHARSPGQSLARHKSGVLGACLKSQQSVGEGRRSMFKVKCHLCYTESLRPAWDARHTLSQ